MSVRIGTPIRSLTAASTRNPSSRPGPRNDRPDVRFAFGLLDQIIAQGRDSRLYDALVQRSGLTSDVSAGINWGLGNMFNYNGPMLWMASLFHDKVLSIHDVKAYLAERQIPVRV